ncbi:hypothetical protein Hanom_Chr05g00433421 [Helianthus anomalus]
MNIEFSYLHRLIVEYQFCANCKWNWQCGLLLLYEHQFSALSLRNSNDTN